MKRTLSLLALVGFTACTTTVPESKFNQLSKRQQEDVRFNTGMQSYMQRDTNAVPKLRKQLLVSDLAHYTEFPKASFTVHHLPPGDTTNDLYWEGKVDTTLLVNPSIATLEKLAHVLPQKGTITQLTFPDTTGIISAESGLRCMQYIPAGTNTGLGIHFTRVQGIASNNHDTSSYSFTITSGLPTSTVKGTEKNYRGLLNTLETTGAGMAIVPLAGGIVGIGQAFQESSLYFDLRNPRVAQTLVHTISDLSPAQARIRLVADTAREQKANRIYVFTTTNGTLIVYGDDTKHHLTGPDSAHKLPAHAFYADKRIQAEHHLWGFMQRAVGAGGIAGLTYAFPLNSKTSTTTPGTPGPGIPGGAAPGASGGR